MWVESLGPVCNWSIWSLGHWRVSNWSVWGLSDRCASNWSIRGLGLNREVCIRWYCRWTRSWGIDLGFRCLNRSIRWARSVHWSMSYWSVCWGESEDRSVSDWLIWPRCVRSLCNWVDGNKSSWSNIRPLCWLVGNRLECNRLVRLRCGWPICVDWSGHDWCCSLGSLRLRWVVGWQDGTTSCPDRHVRATIKLLLGPAADTSVAVGFGPVTVPGMVLPLHNTLLTSDGARQPDVHLNRAHL